MPRPNGVPTGKLSVSDVFLLAAVLQVGTQSGSDTVARAARDGATLLRTSSTLLTTAATQSTAPYDPANAIKFTILRLEPSGSAGGPDIFGAQQYAPLLDIGVLDA